MADDLARLRYLVLVSCLVFGWALAEAAKTPCWQSALLCVVATAALAFVTAERVRILEESRP